MSRTIFDDVFRTMVEKLPYLAVPLINEVFETSYPEKMQQLLNEYEEIRRRLNEELVEERKSDLYADLTDWIVRIADYIFRNEDAARKGINGIMQGKVLKLKSEELREEGREEERKLTARSLAKEGDSLEKIARVLHESEETIKKWIDEQAIEEERRRKEAESN